MTSDYMRGYRRGLADGTAAEHERIAALAEQYGAAYPVTRQDTYGQEYEAGESFADLIREEAEYEPGNARGTS